MKLNSVFYRQDSWRTSLLLQQVYDTRKEKGIMLGCVCTQDAKEDSKDILLCDRLLAAFRQNILPCNTENMEKCCTYIKGVLEKSLNAAYSCSGMFLNGDEILLFGYGNQRIYLLNSAFMRPHLELITREVKPDELFFNIYKIEAGAGIIAATEPFYEYMDEEMLRECLYVRDDTTGVKAGKHISEYGRYLEAEGGHDMGAVLTKLVME
jgi:hypothetical protein